MFGISWAIIRSGLCQLSYSYDIYEERPFGILISWPDLLWRISFRTLIAIPAFLLFYGFLLESNAMAFSWCGLSMLLVTCFAFAISQVRQPAKGPPREAWGTALLFGGTFILLPVIGSVVAAALGNPNLPHANAVIDRQLVTVTCLTAWMGLTIGGQGGFEKLRHLGSTATILQTLFLQISLPLIGMGYAFDLFARLSGFSQLAIFVVGFLAIRYGVLAYIDWRLGVLSRSQQVDTFDAMTDLLKGYAINSISFARLALPFRY